MQKNIIEEDIRNILNLNSLSHDEQKKIVNILAGGVLEAVVLRIEQILSADKKPEFVRLFEEESSEEDRARFLRENVPNIAELILEEVERLKKRAKEHMGSSVKK